MKIKTAPIEMRGLLKKMRSIGQPVNEDNKASKQNLTMREMLKITRKLNEEDQTQTINREVASDEANEEKKFLEQFRDLNVSARFDDLKVTDTYVLWGGTVNGIIQFVYTFVIGDQPIVPDFQYLKGFSPDDPENDEIIKRIKAYYNKFYKYWNENLA